MKDFWTKYKDGIIQLILFLATVYTTTLAGQDWVHGKELSEGLIYSVPFLFILTCHEFGHYFMAKYHHVKATLPYYIPMYFAGISISIGTMGAFIKMKSPAITTKQIFDIGIAGPLAGFVVALCIMTYAYSNLPQKSYINTIHPEYIALGSNYEQKAFSYPFIRFQDSLRFEKAKSDSIKKGLSPRHKVFQGAEEYQLLKLGDNLLMSFFAEYVADKSLVPSSFEMYHYPLLMVSFLALFFTSLNLMPIGQLDGGHIMFGLIGQKAFNIVSPLAFFAFVFYGGLGFVTPFMSTDDLTTWGVLYVLYLYWVFKNVFQETMNVYIAVLSMVALQTLTVVVFPGVTGYDGWLAFGFLLGRVLGVYHPPVLIEERLGFGRKLLGWIAIVIFVISFSPAPFDFVTIVK